MIYEFKGVRPKLGSEVFLAPGTVVLGDVTIGARTNIWFHTVIRGDVNYVRIGTETNIQDLCMLHVTGDGFPLTIGNNVIVGHRAVLHGCEIGDDVLIGIGALVLDGAKVERGAIIGAGSVVTPGTVIPADTLALGTPARPTRVPSEAEREFHQKNVAKYGLYAKNFSHVVTEVKFDDCLLTSPS
jgi:carbonic anhydrase/acetyltransferase-like protein (isoleucine patch superfamily)